MPSVNGTAAAAGSGLPPASALRGETVAHARALAPATFRNCRLFDPIVIASLLGLPDSTRPGVLAPPRD